jgi:prefoldin subunit 5
MSKQYVLYQVLGWKKGMEYGEGLEAKYTFDEAIKQYKDAIKEYDRVTLTENIVASVLLKEFDNGLIQ